MITFLHVVEVGQKGEPMVILDTFTGWNCWQAILCVVVMALSSIFAVVAAFDWMESYREKVPVITFIISICFFILAMIGEVITSETGYKVYLTDMSLNEFETEYDVTDIDGLILEAYKKKERKVNEVN